MASIAAGHATFRLLSPGRESHAPGMFVVSKADAAAIRTAFEQRVSYPLQSSCAGASRASSTMSRQALCAPHRWLEAAAEAPASAEESCSWHLTFYVG